MRSIKCPLEQMLTLTKYMFQLKMQNQALEAQDLANKTVETAQQAVKKLEADVAELQSSAAGSEPRPVLTALRENLRDAVARLAQIDALPGDVAADVRGGGVFDDRVSA